MKCVLFTAVALVILTQVVELDMERGRLTTVSLVSEKSLISDHGSANSKNHDERFQCYSLQNDLSKAFEGGKIEQTFILVPAKAGGTSLKVFAGACMGDPKRKHHIGNFMGSQDRCILPFFHNTIQPPPLAASHVVQQQVMLDLIRHATTKTLIIYIYREETERLMSAIAFVLKSRICTGEIEGELFQQLYNETGVELSYNETDGSHRCSVPERPFLENFVKRRYIEIGHSVDENLGCGLWEEIDETAPPHMIFVHYSQSDMLQEQLAKHYCPNTTTPMRANVSTDPVETTIFLRTAEGKEYEMKEWLAAKRNTLEYAYQLAGGTCKHERRSMESIFETCEDQTVQAFRKEH